MAIKQKLELTWIGKDKTIKVEPRILIHDATKDYGDKNTDNMLIYGDNLLALKALEQEYAGKVKCIYIDPPYNTGSRIDADGNEVGYDDNLEHSTWLSLMKPRLEIMRNLLSNDGSIWISIDEKEGHYLKVLCDEVFKRKNFIIQTIVQRGAATGHKAINPTPVQVCDLMLAYAKDKDSYVYHPVYKSREYDEAYNSIIINYEEPYNQWHFCSLKEYLNQNNKSLQYCLTHFPERIIRFAQPDYANVGKDIREAIDLSKKNPQIIYKHSRTAHPDLFLLNGNRILFYKDKMRLVDGKLVTAELVTNLWTDMNYQGIAREGGVTFKRGKKPEVQIKRILEMSTEKGDLVLDSFLGSGTTAAVAHKMHRKYIGVEMALHCHTHCIPRLQKVIDGTDQGGISKAVGWKGGGGFKYYYLAPSLLNKDKYGQYVISKEYNADMLAAAMAKHEGFLYAPDQDQFWKQGKSSENDYIYTTTSHVGEQALSAISADMKDGESLLICCKSFDKGLEGAFPNISIKKIPAAILGRCEFGKDNYNLNIINPSAVEEEEE